MIKILSPLPNQQLLRLFSIIDLGLRTRPNEMGKKCHRRIAPIAWKDLVETHRAAWLTRGGCLQGGGPMRGGGS